MAQPHELRDKGLRLTPQRELVLAAVRQLGHATPEEVAEKVRETHPGINLSTVYAISKLSRTSDWFNTLTSVTVVRPITQPKS